MSVKDGREEIEIGGDRSTRLRLRFEKTLSSKESFDEQRNGEERVEEKRSTQAVSQVGKRFK